MEFSVGSIALVAAIAIDVLFGELPNRLHPVAWMGQGIARFVAVAPKSAKLLPLAAGLLLVLSGMTLCAVLGWQIQRLTTGYPLLVAAGLQALVLKQTFSVRSLAGAAHSVAAGLQAGDLPAARQRLAFHLVSRDTSQLDASQIAAATIESVAENTSDSLVAPLFYFAIAGLPGALVYRFVNTCDAMVGYHNERFEWFGKPAARIDDLANLIPARLTALTILVAGAVLAGQPRRAAWIWFRDRYATDSPNAGQPMSATAGVLGVELEKVGCYRLGRGQRKPDRSDIRRAVGLLWFTCGATGLAAAYWLHYQGAR